MVHQHKGTIYTVCYLFSKQADEVEDLVQEVLINLWRGYPRFEGRSEIRTWIWRVSLNTCLSAERSKRRRSSIPLELSFDPYRDSDYESRQIRMLYERIHCLGPFDRAIVLMWLEHMPYEEIASIVGISVKALSVRLVRIKESLKKMSNPEKSRL